MKIIKKILILKIKTINLILMINNSKLNNNNLKKVEVNNKIRRRNLFKRRHYKPKCGYQISLKTIIKDKHYIKINRNNLHKLSLKIIRKLSNKNILLESIKI